MLRWILIGVLAVANIATGYWGYLEHQEKNAVLIQAENTYQRAFHDLSYRMDLLHDKIGTTLAMSSKDRLSPQLVEIWRLTAQAHSDVGQLPLSLLPFNKTEEFLSNIGDFTYRTSVRDLDNDPLSDQEVASLRDLYGQAGQIKDELRQVQHLALKNNLRWMDVQLALANDNQPADNTIIDGFKTVEKHVEGFAEGNTDSTILGTTNKDHQFNFLTGSDMSEQEALEQSQKLFNINNKENITMAKSGDGADVPIYSVSYKDGDKNAYMDITEKGGHPLSLLVNRPIENKKLSLNDGYEKAKKYLEEFDYKNMTLFRSSEFDNIGVYSFLYQQDNVRIYPDSIVVKVALDNGDIIGLSTKDYLMNHKNRNIPKPSLSIDDAKKKVNPNIKIMEEHLSIIDNDLNEEVLTYEFLGVLHDETYRIFINAMDGTEEKVEKLSGTEINYSGNF